MRKIFPLALMTVIIMSSCLKGKNIVCNYNDCGFTVPNAEILAWQNYLAANSITAVQHCSGMFYRIEIPGTGQNPVICSHVSVRYKGYFTNGAVFDEATTSIPIGLSQVISGWKNGIPLLKTGGLIVLYIPPSLGYGTQDVRDQNGNIVIPANSYLIFEVNLDAII